MDPRYRSAVARERRRLQKRRELVGQNVRLPREWADALNPDSPFALNPHMAWLEWAGRSRWHDELRWMKWATVLPDGTLLKGYSEDGLEQLKTTVLRVRPVMEHFGIYCPAFYQNQGRKWLGGCSYEEEWEGITIPQVIVLSTKVKYDNDATLRDLPPHHLRWNLLHEVSHLSRLGDDTERPRSKRWGQSNDDYQRSLHSEKFCRRFGEILDFYLENCADPCDPWERRTLTLLADTDDYAPPIHPEGKSWRS
jgi:hypothetical protein